MTSGGPSEHTDLTGMTVAELISQISQDHAVATEAGKTQSETLQAMGRKAAEVYRRGGISWRELAQAVDMSTRTVKRHAEPYLP